MFSEWQTNEAAQSKDAPTRLAHKMRKYAARAKERMQEESFGYFANPDYKEVSGDSRRQQTFGPQIIKSDTHMKFQKLRGKKKEENEEPEEIWLVCLKICLRI